MSIFVSIIKLTGSQAVINLELDIDYKSNKGLRLLSIYERLNKGELIEKAKIAEHFKVTQKTIQRDIDDLRIYLAENHSFENETAIKYDKARNGYYLVRFEREWLTNEEVLALCKILLESRAFCREELNTLIGKLLVQAVPGDRRKVENIIRSEQHHYVPLKHERKLLSILWELAQLITGNEIAQFTYKRQDGSIKNRAVKPVAIMFSEYYFYLIAYMADGSKEFPTVFRVDRISKLRGTEQHFSTPYRDMFSEGEFRKRIQFMYSGELRKVEFKFSGPSIESVLDRLPTAEILEEKSGVYTIKAEVFGNGIDMWLRSQGSYIQQL